MDLKEKQREACAKWRKKNRKSIRDRDLRRNSELKLDVLSFYGPNKALKCSWPGCEVTDIDMLTLDHVYNDGAEDRKKYTHSRGGVAFYRRLKNSGYPLGFQTLCWNHQWKKQFAFYRGIP